MQRIYFLFDPDGQLVLKSPVFATLVAYYLTIVGMFKQVTPQSGSIDGFAINRDSKVPVSCSKICSIDNYLVGIQDEDEEPQGFPDDPDNSQYEDSVDDYTDAMNNVTYDGGLELPSSFDDYNNLNTEQYNQSPTNLNGGDDIDYQ